MRMSNNDWTDRTENISAGSSDVQVSTKQNFDRWADELADITPYCALILFRYAVPHRPAIIQCKAERRSAMVITPLLRIREIPRKVLGPDTFSYITPYKQTNIVSFNTVFNSSFRIILSSKAS
jgi:hypothetical protein